MILDTDGIKLAKTNRSFHKWKYRPGETSCATPAGTIRREAPQATPSAHADIPCACHARTRARTGLPRNISILDDAVI